MEKSLFVLYAMEMSITEKPSQLHQTGGFRLSELKEFIKQCIDNSVLEIKQETSNLYEKLIEESDHNKNQNSLRNWKKR